MSSNVVFCWLESVDPRPRNGRAPRISRSSRSTSAVCNSQVQIQSFEAVFLDPHGGDLNGFFLIRGEPAKLDTVIASDAWHTHLTRGGLHLDGLGVIRGATGELVMERMALWSKLIPA